MFLNVRTLKHVAKARIHWNTPSIVLIHSSCVVSMANGKDWRVTETLSSSPKGLDWISYHFFIPQCGCKYHSGLSTRLYLRSTVSNRLQDDFNQLQLWYCFEITCKSQEEYTSTSYLRITSAAGVPAHFLFPLIWAQTARIGVPSPTTLDRVLLSCAPQSSGRPHFWPVSLEDPTLLEMWIGRHHLSKEVKCCSSMSISLFNSENCRSLRRCLSWWGDLGVFSCPI
jgi:hypothetical protein